jgi:hypothetical protein
MNFWTDLVDAAVLGTGRATPPSPPASLASLTAGPELLRLAAVASRARRACYVPPVTTDLTPDQAPPDHRPGVSVAARVRLAGLLADEREDLVIEWLRLLAGTGCRPPEAQLPTLLWRAADSEQLRDALVPVLGPLAAWLAAANPRWDWVIAAGQAGPDTWTTASHRTRRELLDQVRRTDPAAGRELVTATWQGDSTRDRAAFIAGLATGLSADDEPLLDRALADNRGEVRQAAAGLLAKLPGSAFSQRAAARAAAAVGVREAGQLIVTPPAEATQEMIADGIDARPPRGTGLRAWLLRQVTAAVPAAWWTEYTGLPPAELLAIAAPTAWAAELETGWTECAMRDAHVPWLTALLDRSTGEMATDLLKALPAPWSAKLSAVARDRILALTSADQRGQASNQARRLLRIAAARLDPPFMPDVDPAQVPQGLADAWAKMMTTLSVRAAMRREITQEPAP